jgi:acyl dehydratase
MRYFDDLPVGEKLCVGELKVDAAEAAEFACRYDPKCAPHPLVYYSGGGPEISPWLVAALSWKMLSDFAEAQSIIEGAFSQPSELEWRHQVSPGDVLRTELKILERLPPHILEPKHGRCKVHVLVTATGQAGLGTWSQDEAELAENVALSYSARLKALKRDEASTG